MRERLWNLSPQTSTIPEPVQGCELRASIDGLAITTHYYRGYYTLMAPPIEERGCTAGEILVALASMENDIAELEQRAGDLGL